MANKDRNKRSARKARAAERERVEAARAASAPVEEEKSSKGLLAKFTKSDKKEQDKKESTKAVAKKDPNKKPGFFGRIKNYLSDVRIEMKRVIWPSKAELKSYSVAIIAMLIVFGVVIWLVDTGLVAVISAFTGLRG